MKSSLGKKVAGGFVLALPVLLIIYLVQYRTIFTLIESHHGAAHAAEALGAIEATFSALKDAEIRARGYVITGETSYLNPYQAALIVVGDDLQSVRQLTAGNRRQQDRLRKLEPLIAQKIGQLQQAIDSRKQEAHSGAEQGVVELQGQKLMDNIREVIDEMKTQQQEVLKQRNAAARASARLTPFITTFGAALTLWLVALAALLLHRRATEQRWAAVERRLHARLLETMPVGVCLTDESGVILYTNPAEDALFGYKLEELIGKNVTLLSSSPPEENFEMGNETLKQSNSRGPWAGGFVGRRKNGTTFTGYARVSTMEASGKLSRLFVHEDITERNRAQAELGRTK